MKIVIEIDTIIHITSNITEATSSVNIEGYKVLDKDEELKLQKILNYLQDELITKEP